MFKSNSTVTVYLISVDICKVTTTHDSHVHIFPITYHSSINCICIVTFITPPPHTKYYNYFSLLLFSFKRKHKTKHASRFIPQTRSFRADERCLLIGRLGATHLAYKYSIFRFWLFISYPYSKATSCQDEAKAVK